MEIIECLKKYGQRLDFEIAEETGIAIAMCVSDWLPWLVPAL